MKKKKFYNIATPGSGQTASFELGLEGRLVALIDGRNFDLRKNRFSSNQRHLLIKLSLEGKISVRNAAFVHIVVTA
jgi:hypothetical protein